MSKYRYRGCEIYSIGYYEPEHRVVWEAVDEKTHEAVAHGYSMREVMMIILENQLREEYETKIRKLEEEIERLKKNEPTTNIPRTHRQDRRASNSLRRKR